MNNRAHGDGSGQPECVQVVAADDLFSRKRSGFECV